MDYLDKIKNNSLVQSKMFFKISVSLVIILVIYVIYSFYQSIVKQQRSQPVLIRNPKDGKKELVIKSDLLPVLSDGMGYSVSVWIWIDDFNYKYGKFAHILHRGDSNADSVQPGIWLHPTNNTLLIKYDNDSRDINYDYTDNKIIKSLTKDRAHDIVHGGTVQSAKDKCSINSNCLGFSAILDDPNNDNSNIYQALYPITDEDSDLITTDKFNHSGLGKGTFMKNNESRTMNPNINKKIINNNKVSNNINNIPLNKWFNITVVVHNQVIEAYLNGRLSHTTTMPSHIKQNNGNIYVNSDGGFGGYITNLQYFNKSLSDVDISKLYYKGPKPFLLPDLNNYESKIQSDMEKDFHINKYLGEAEADLQLNKINNYI